MSLQFFCFCLVFGALAGWIVNYVSPPLFRQKMLPFLINLVTGSVGALATGLFVSIVAGNNLVNALWLFSPPIFGGILAALASFYIADDAV